MSWTRLDLSDITSKHKTIPSNNQSNILKDINTQNQSWKRFGRSIIVRLAALPPYRRLRFYITYTWYTTPNICHHPHGDRVSGSETWSPDGRIRIRCCLSYYTVRHLHDAPGPSGRWVRRPDSHCLAMTSSGSTLCFNSHSSEETIMTSHANANAQVHRIWRGRWGEKTPTEHTSNDKRDLIFPWGRYASKRTNHATVSEFPASIHVLLIRAKNRGR